MKTAAVLCAAAVMLGAAPLLAQDAPPPPEAATPPAPEAAPPAAPEAAPSPPKSVERLPSAPRGKQGREGPSLKYHTEDAKLDIECGPELDLKSCTEIAVDFFRRIQKSD